MVPLKAESWLVFLFLAAVFSQRVKARTGEIARNLGKNPRTLPTVSRRLNSISLCLVCGWKGGKLPDNLSCKSRFSNPPFHLQKSSAALHSCRRASPGRTRSLAALESLGRESEVGTVEELQRLGDPLQALQVWLFFFQDSARFLQVNRLTDLSRESHEN